MNGSVLFEGNQLLSGSLNVNTGGNIVPLEVEINENGTRTITPPSGVDGYAPITIETIVPQIVPILETLNVTQNGRYEPPSGVAGFDEVNVEVLHPLDTLTVTENGSYEPPTGVYGFSNVIVNVPTQENIIQAPRYALYNEQNINVVLNYDNSINIIWDSGSTMGCSLNGIIDLSNKNFTKLKYSLSFGAKNYDSQNGQNIRPFIIGVTDQIRTQYVYANQSTAPTYFKAYDIYDANYLNQNIIGEVDISNVTGPFYLLVVATGWNVTINKLELT